MIRAFVHYGGGPERPLQNGERGTLHLGWQQGWTFYPANANTPVEHQDPRLGKPDRGLRRQYRTGWQYPECHPQNSIHLLWL